MRALRKHQDRIIRIKRAHNIEFRIGTSRGRDTYGYTIVTLYVDGVKKAQVNGGGYDMCGACLGVWLTKDFNKELQTLTARTDLTPRGFYGLSHYNKLTKRRQSRASKNTDTYVDGACGQSSVERIINAIGVDFIDITRRSRG